MVLFQFYNCSTFNYSTIVKSIISEIIIQNGASTQRFQAFGSVKHVLASNLMEIF
jgi:hypothetical protein